VNSDSNGIQHAESLYEIVNKNTGTEQHRHHAVEVSLYNLYAYLWEVETGLPYKMQKAHDIYSGLGKEYKQIPTATEIEDLLERGEEKKENEAEKKEDEDVKPADKAENTQEDTVKVDQENKTDSRVSESGDKVKPQKGKGEKEGTGKSELLLFPVLLFISHDGRASIY
jgi:hypothetical protein